MQSNLLALGFVYGYRSEFKFVTMLFCDTLSGEKLIHLRLLYMHLKVRK